MDKHLPSLRLRQKVKQNKLFELYRHLNVTGDLDLINLNQFKVTRDPQKRSYSFRALQWW